MNAGDGQVDAFRKLIETIVAGDADATIGLLDASPQLARGCATSGATRQAAEEHFFANIRHYMYGGDTALHLAAAAHQIRIVDELLLRGADVRAKNRRGAEPLHYAVDGGPGPPEWNPLAQIAIVERLIGAGADPNALDKSGVSPLHRAVRNRCAAAVKALIDGGADPHARNGKGSTPLLLATQNTGHSGSGSPAAKAQQREILDLLAEHGAEPEGAL